MSSGPTGSGILEGNLREFFSSLLQDAAQNQKYPLSPWAKSYVTDVLVGFHETARLFVQEGVRVPVLADMLSAALEADMVRRIVLLQQMGDTSLMVSGYFPEALARRAVDLHYYQRMGEIAYTQLSSLSERQNVFVELSHEFAKLSGLINEVSETTHDKSYSALKLLELYMETRSDRALERLKSQGVIPLPKRR